MGVVNLAVVESTRLSAKIARGWTGCLSNRPFPFSLDKQSTQEMTKRGDLATTRVG